MLNDKDVYATIAVKDLAVARKFYEGTLGLKQSKEEDGGGGVLYGSGASALFVYQSSFAGTNKATAATWSVGKELAKTVEKLKNKGVQFEHYDSIPGVKRDGDIHTFGDLHAAWFKDPDGNILNLNNG